MWGEFFNMSDLENQKRAIRSARQCQRNWDLTKTVPDEHIDHWIDLATHAPSKQDEAFFDLYVLTDREKIDFLCKEHSWGFTMLPGVNDWVTRNPQMGANVLFIFNRKMPSIEIRNNEKDGSFREYNHPHRVNNQYTSIGIASGIVTFSANQMGYVTGYGKNFGFIEEPKHSQDVWGEVLGIPKEENHLTYSVGIGYPTEGLLWNESKDNKEFLVGGPVNYEVRTATYDYKYSQYSKTKRDIKVVKI